MLTTYVVMHILGDDLNGMARTRIASKEYLDRDRAVQALRECEQEFPLNEYALFSRTITNWKSFDLVANETDEAALGG